MTSTDDKTLLMVTVDTEEEWDWAAGWPPTTPSVDNVHRLSRFQELCERHRIRPTYFANHAVMNEPRTAAVMRGLAARDGVEVGLHIHPWNTPPLSPQPVDARSTFLHNLPDGEVLAKLRSLLDAFARNGLRPTSFRGGRYSTDARIQAILRDNGVLADASVVPYTTWPDAGAPDFRSRGLAPVRRAPRRDGDAPLWEIPLTLAFTRRPFGLWRAVYETVEKTALRHLHLIGVLERLGVVRRVWLNFELESAERICDFLRRLRRWGTGVACLTVHSSSLAAGPSPYAKTAADEERRYRDIERVFAAVGDSAGFEPVTVTRAALRLEERFDASTGD